ncbi:hypothetical protein GCM10017687_81080 [Streptomyces echinatus]
MLELAAAGAKVWVAGYPNALRRASAEPVPPPRAAGDVDTRSPVRQLHPLLRWDSKGGVVQRSSSPWTRRDGVRRPWLRPPPRTVACPTGGRTVRAATEKAVAAASRKEPDHAQQARPARVALAHRGHADPAWSRHGIGTVPGATMNERRLYFRKHRDHLSAC